MAPFYHDLSTAQMMIAMRYRLLHTARRIEAHEAEAFALTARGLHYRRFFHGAEALEMIEQHIVSDGGGQRANKYFPRRESALAARWTRRTVVARCALLVTITIAIAAICAVVVARWRRSVSEVMRRHMMRRRPIAHRRRRTASRTVKWRRHEAVRERRTAPKRRRWSAERRSTRSALASSTGILTGERADRLSRAQRHAAALDFELGVAMRCECCFCTALVRKYNESKLTTLIGELIALHVHVGDGAVLLEYLTQAVLTRRRGQTT